MTAQSTITDIMTESIFVVNSSPKSVADFQNPKVAELEDLDLDQLHHVKATSYDQTGHDEKKDEIDLVLRRSTTWLSCPASKKSLRTQNPIRAIVDPIVKNIQSGTDRGDGKDHISLAVRTQGLEALVSQRKNRSLST
jgi:hypothetical protein